MPSELRSRPPEALRARLSPRDAKFLDRVLAEGIQKYSCRLEAIGFTGLDSVLDAGCGFGQWSFALARTCRSVHGIDISEDRVNVARALDLASNRPVFHVGSIEDLPFADRSFDAVLCYSAIYYTDVRKSLREFRRVLRPGGKLYVCSNGLGWYVHNLVRGPNPSPDFNPRQYALGALRDTVRYWLGLGAPREGGSVVTGMGAMKRLMRRQGLTVLAAGGEGTVRVGSAGPPKPFFRGRYCGMQGVLEWLAQAPPSGIRQ